MNCVVCDNPNGLGCEFCPRRPIIDRDPGDEHPLTTYITVTFRFDHPRDGKQFAHAITSHPNWVAHSIEEL